jgi:septal ring factor EnvC (AmiA/AmiB activator)
MDVVLSPATATVRIETGATGYVTFNLDTTQPVQEQLKRLADFVNNRSKESDFVQQKLIELGRELRQIRDQTAELERKTLERIQTQINELDQKINRTQVLDLIPAIVGLGISFLGTIFGLGT